MVWGSTSPAQAAAEPAEDSVQRLALPLVYHDLLGDIATVFVPLHPQEALRNLRLQCPQLQCPLPLYTSTDGRSVTAGERSRDVTAVTAHSAAAVFASMIDTVSSADVLLRTSEPSGSASSWVGNATSNGRFPLCQLEGSLPFPIYDTLTLSQYFGELAATVQQPPAGKDSVIKPPTVFPRGNYSSLRDNNAAGATGATLLPVLNPYLANMSHVGMTRYNDPEVLIERKSVLRHASGRLVRQRRAFTNTLGFRGVNIPGTACMYVMSVMTYIYLHVQQRCTDH